MELHKYCADDAADNADESAAEDLCQGVLAEYHAAGHNAARDEDGEREPPNGIEAENGCVGYQRSDDTARACGMHADLPPHVDHDTNALYEQRNADDGHQEVRHVGDGEDMHEAQITTDVNDIRHSAFVAFAQLEGTPAMQPSVNENAKGGQEESEEIDKHKYSEPEDPWEEIQVGEA